MNVKVEYNCPHCEAVSEANFDIGEHYTDLDKCPECGKPISLESFCQMEVDAYSAAIEKSECFRD